MPLTLDPEFAKAIAPMAEAMAARPKLPAGDVEGRRAASAAAFQGMLATMPSYPNVKRTKHEFQSVDGTTIILNEFRKGDSKPTSPEKVIYYIHGGGMIMGSVDAFSKSIEKRVEEMGISIFAVSYRLAPEFPHPKPVEDCYSGLVYLSQNAAQFGADPARIVLWGESAGGGLAAGTALMARDQGLSPPIRKQILIFPMLDDRNTTPIPAIEPFAVWSNADNVTGWGALLGSAAGGADVSQYAAPARAEDLSGLPDTYIDCGNLDIFVDEDMEYGKRLAKAGVMVEMHIYPGVPHGFQMFGGMDVRVVRMAVENVRNAVESV